MSAQDQTPHQTTVLIVDDNVMDRYITREALEQAGFDVLEAGDGEEALAVFAERQPQFLLLDVKMPRMDGFAVCENIRATPVGLHTPILMMTGLNDVESINRAYDVGATDFITKPINGAILTHRIRYILRAQQTADELRHNESLLADAQKVAKLGSWDWNLSQRRITWSEEAGRIVGTEARSTHGSIKELLQTVHPDDRTIVEDTIEEILARHERRSLEYRVVRPDGSERVVHQELDIRVSDEEVVRMFGTVQDITERRETEERIRYLAYYDSVTGLPNRALFKEQVRQALLRAKRFARRTSILFLDLDHFKRINDTLGHSAGDKLLHMVAERLSHCVRDCDYLGRENDFSSFEETCGPSTVARLGGDEFVILLSELRTPEDAAIVANRVITALGDPFSLAGNEVYVSGSIGISTYPDDGDDHELLLKHADAAMYHAKSDGRNRYQFYTSSMNERALERLSMESDLRKAIEKSQFVLHYQPKIDIATGAITGCEALIRWHYPERGFISPGEFIPIAEETGLITPIGEWVLREACFQAKAWQQEGLPPLQVSVNISTVQCSNENFRDDVARALKETGLPAERLELEVTESLLMRDMDASIDLLNQLKALGVRVSIDDFGTGYSSLSYLKKLPLDTLKIDRSFINDITTDSDDASIVSATIALGHNLRLSVVAEGVETEEQLEFLSQHNCDQIQGFLFSKPLAPVEFKEWANEYMNPRKAV